MTEEEFKAKYIKSFLQAYKTVVGFEEFYFATVPKEVEELFNLAKEKAEIAWKQYVKDTAV